MPQGPCTPSDSNDKKMSWNSLIKECCQVMHQARYQKGPIVLLESQNIIKEILKNYRDNEVLISKLLIYEIVKQLESDDLCSRIHESLVVLIIEVILQSEQSRINERGIYLLAISLFNESITPEKCGKPSLRRRKEYIAIKSLPLLINYLISPKNNLTKRRWIGILCYELYRGLIENNEFTSIDLDNNRQQLGRLIIEEPDKIVKIICAQIVKDLCSKGARAEDLFPRNYDKLVHIEFLVAIQEEKTWFHSFQRYLFSISKQIDCYQEQVDKIFPLISIILNPYHLLSCGNQINFMVLNEKSITILLSPTSTKVTQIFEISLNSIGKLRYYIYDEISRPLSAIFEIQFKEGPENSNLLNGKDIQLINTRLQLPIQDGNNFQNNLAKILPEIKIEVDTELDRIPDSQELPISYLSTHCSACEILVRRGSWSDKILDRDYRNQIMEANDTCLNFRGEIKEKMVKFKDQNLVIQKPNTPYENTKPKAKQPLVSSRRSFGNFQGNNHSLKSKPFGQVSEIENLPNLNEPEETMEPKVGASNPITALPTPSSNVKLQSNIIEKQSLPTLIEDNDIHAETGTENVKQAAALKKNVSMIRKTQKRKKKVIKKVKKNDERRSSPILNIQNTQSKTGKNIAIKKEKSGTELSEIPVEPCTFPREIVQSDQISKPTTNKTEKSQITHLIQPAATMSNRDIQQQQDAIALGFVAEQSLNDQHLCEDYSKGPKVSNQPQVENISIDEQSVLRKETLKLQEKLSLLSKYDIALIKGLNSMVDEIDNNNESYRTKNLHQITPKIFKIQSEDPKCEENLNLTSQSKINFLELASSTEKIRKEIFTPKLVAKDTPIKNSGQMQRYEGNAMRLSETIDFSPDATLNRKDHCELGKSMSIIPDISTDFVAPKPTSEPIITPKSKVMALDSSKKRTSSHDEDKRHKKKCKNDYRVSPVPHNNDFSKSSKSDGSCKIDPNSEQGESFKEKQLRYLAAITEKDREQAEIRYDKRMKLPPYNSLGFNEDKNDDFIPKSHQLKQDSLHNQFAQKPKLISFELQGACNQGKIRKSSLIQAIPKSVKRDFHECKYKTLPKKLRNKTHIEEIYVNSYCGSTRSSPMRSESDTNNSRNHTSPITVGIFSFNTNSASKYPNLTKKECEPSFKISTSPVYRRASPKPGFQGLKVTDEGSPISKKDIRQIYRGNLGTKTGEFRNKKREANDDVQDGKIYSSFKSKIALAKGLSAASLSPGKRNNLSLYETTDNIDFTDMDSREVISQKAMHDPFRTQDSKSQRQNHFIELLQGTFTKNSRVMGSKSDQVFSSKPTKPFQPSSLEVSEKNSLSDGSSTKVKKRNEKWNMAIRTRYDGIYDSVHEIADDLITRLVREEDRMKLLIDQYSRNGAKIINYLSTYRVEEQALILKRLETLKTDILDRESKALTALTKIYDNIQINSRINTLTAWEKKNNEIRVMINESRKQHNNCI